jgi:hypothetical protein
VFFVLHLTSNAIPSLSTDCPEMIELVNHSATVLVRFKSSYLIFFLFAKRRAVEVVAVFPMFFFK